MTDKTKSSHPSIGPSGGVSMDKMAMADKDRLLKAMHDISQTILSTMDMEYIQDTLSEQIVQAGIFRSLMLAVVDEHDHVVRVVKSVVRKTDGTVADRSEDVAGRTYDMEGDHLLADIVRSGAMEIIDGWDDRFDPDISRPESFKDRVSYFIPVALRGEVKAVVATGSIRSDRAEVEKRIEFIQPLLNYLAIALDHANQYWKAQEYSLQLAALNTRFEQEILDRRHAEQEARTALSLTRAILESTADGLLVLDPSGKKILDYNQKFVTMWKIPEALMDDRQDDQVYAHILSQLVNPEAFQQKVRTTYENPEAESSDIIYFKDGRVFERYMIPQRIDGELVGRVWSFHDITARVRAEEDRDRYFNLSLDMQCIAGFDGYFKRLNPVWTRALGYTLDELLTRPFVDFVHPDDKERTVKESAKLAEGAETIAFENRYLCKDGAYRWLSWNATIDIDRALIYATARDITEQKWITSALRDSEAQYRDLFENASDLIQSVKADGRLIYVNRTWRETLGYSEREAAFLFMQDFIHPDHLESCLRVFNRIKSGENIQNIETVFITKGGQAIDVEGNISCKFDDSGELVSTRGIFRDITHRKEIDRLKNEFISTVSHELRTPLTSIHGSLGLLLGGVAEELSGQSKSLIDIAYNNTERLVRLINDILDIEKIEGGHLVFDLQAVDVMAVVHRAIETSKAYAGQKGVRLHLAETVSETSVYADADRLNQVLDNLLSNAIKFSPEDSEVDIRVTCEEGLLRLAVSDHGPGISEEFQPLVFKKFAQEDGSATRQKGGTGLGLSICKAIVERLEGRIWFETMPGSGTTFYVTLPVYQVPAEDLADHESQESSILVCEDDEMPAFLLKQILSGAGYNVDVARNAVQARQMLKNRSYDAMTLDLILPDQDGLSLLQELRSQEATRQLPIVVVSAMAEDGREQLDHGDAAWVIDWLSKPIQSDRLLAAVHMALHQRTHRLNVLHVEDDIELHTVIRALLEEIADLTQASTLEEAKRMATSNAYDLILLDVELPDGSGMDLLPIVSQTEDRPTPIIIFSAHDQLPGDMAEGIDAMLVKSRITHQELMHTITSIIQANDRET